MNKRLMALFLALSIMLCGCVYGSSGEESSNVCVYRSSSSGGALLVRELVSYSPDKDPVDIILASLNSKPGTVGLGRVFPDGVRAHSCSIENGTATVIMSEDFSKLDDIDRLLCSSAVALSLCTLDEVCAVDIKCGGRVYAEGLRPEDIQYADALYEEHERTVKLFLPMDETDALTPKSRTLQMTGDESVETLVAQAVLDSLPIYTERATVLSAQTADGICTLDISEAFYGNEPADSIDGMLIIYSLVNSLCRLNNINGLVITVEGQTVVSYGGYRASWPLSARDSLIIY